MKVKTLNEEINNLLYELRPYVFHFIDRPQATDYPECNNIIIRLNDIESRLVIQIPSHERFKDGEEIERNEKFFDNGIYDELIEELKSMAIIENGEELAKKGQSQLLQKLIQYGELEDRESFLKAFNDFFNDLPEISPELQSALNEMSSVNFDDIDIDLLDENDPVHKNISDLHKKILSNLPSYKGKGEAFLGKRNGSFEKRLAKLRETLLSIDDNQMKERFLRVINQQLSVILAYEDFNVENTALKEPIKVKYPEDGVHLLLECVCKVNKYYSPLEFYKSQKNLYEGEENKEIEGKKEEASFEKRVVELCAAIRSIDDNQMKERFLSEISEQLSVRLTYENFNAENTALKEAVRVRYPDIDLIQLLLAEVCKENDFYSPLEFYDSRNLVENTSPEFMSKYPEQGKRLKRIFEILNSLEMSEHPEEIAKIAKALQVNKDKLAGYFKTTGKKTDKSKSSQIIHSENKISLARRDYWYSDDDMGKWGKKVIGRLLGEESIATQFNGCLTFDQIGNYLQNLDSGYALKNFEPSEIELVLKMAQECQVLSPILLTLGDDNYKMQEFNHEELKQLRLLLQNNPQLSKKLYSNLDSLNTKPIFMAYNIGGSGNNLLNGGVHWIALTLVKHEDKIKLLYKDSKGDFNSNAEIIKQEFLRYCPDLEFIRHEGVEQTDDYSCGPMTINNLEIIIKHFKEGGLDSLVEGFGKLDFTEQTQVSEIRAKHAGLNFNAFNSNTVSNTIRNEENIKTVEQIINELSLISSDKNEAELKVTIATAIGKINKHYEKVKEWKVDELTGWSKEHKGKLKSNEDEICQAIAVMERANEIATSGHRLRDTQKAAIFLFMQSKDKGHISQINTGEGKTTIVSFVQALKVMQGYKGHVITSNEVLAADGVKSKKLFYDLLDISVADNNPEEGYTQGTKDCYKKDIVYGSINNFQFDWLRHSFEKLETLGDLDLGKTWVMLDEIDSLLIDQGGNIAKLSGPFLGMESLRYVYISIWAALAKAEAETEEEMLKALQGKSKELYKKLYNNKEIISLQEKYKQNLEDIEEKESSSQGEEKNQNIDSEQKELFKKFKLLEDLGKTLNSLLETNKDAEQDLNRLQELQAATQLEYEKFEDEQKANFLDKVKQKVLAKKNELINKDITSKHLHKYAGNSLDRWIEYAFTAKYQYNENVEYKIAQHKNGEKIIVPVDNQNTGVSMKNTILSNGLHQFLQIKHNLCLTYESLTSSYVSNLGYIVNNYGNRLSGVTGTLGSNPERDLLGEVFNLDFSIVPPYKQKRFQEFSGIIAEDNLFVNRVAIAALAELTRMRTIIYKAEETALEEKVEQKEEVGLEAAPRATLIIYSSIHDVEIIEREIRKEADAAGLQPKKIKIYRDEGEAHVTEETLDVNDIVIATNIAGRGTDFKTTSQLEENGGLHVIEAFLPCNQRVQDQGLGRTSRQGHNGTGQIIVRNSELQELGIMFSPEDMVELDMTASLKIEMLHEEDLVLLQKLGLEYDGSNDITFNLKDFKKISHDIKALSFSEEKVTDNESRFKQTLQDKLIFAAIIAQRDKLEKDRVVDIKKNKVLELKFKDALFDCFKELYSGLKDKHKEAEDPQWIYALSDLKEKWAFWLEQQKYTATDIKELTKVQPLEKKSGEQEVPFEKRVNALCNILHAITPEEVKGDCFYRANQLLNTKLELKDFVADSISLKEAIRSKYPDTNIIDKKDGIENLLEEICRTICDNHLLELYKKEKDTYLAVDESIKLIVNREFAKFKEQAQEIIEGQIRHNPFYSICLAERYLEATGVTGNTQKAKSALDNAITISEHSESLYSAHMKLFEVAIESGGQVLERYAKAVAKIFFVSVDKNENYKTEAVAQLNKAKAALLKEHDYLKKLIGIEEEKAEPSFSIVEETQEEKKQENENPIDDNQTESILDSILIPSPINKASTGYWYNDNDMGKLGKKVITELLGEENIATQFNGCLTFDQIENYLAHLNFDELDTKPVFIAYNIGGSTGNISERGTHWVALALVKHEEKVKLLYKDSKGDFNGNAENIKQKFQIHHPNIEFIRHEGAEQTDSNACGPMTIKNLEIIIKKFKEDGVNSLVADFKDLKFTQQEQVEAIRQIYASSLGGNQVEEVNYFVKHLQSRYIVLNTYLGNIDSLLQQLAYDDKMLNSLLNQLKILLDKSKEVNDSLIKSYSVEEQEEAKHILDYPFEIDILNPAMPPSEKVLSLYYILKNNKEIEKVRNLAKENEGKGIIQNKEAILKFVNEIPSHANIEDQKKQVITLMESIIKDGAVIGTKIPRYLSKLDSKLEHEKKLKEQITNQEVNELEYIGMSSIIQLKEVYDVSNEVITNAQWQIGSGIAALAITIPFPFLLPVNGPIAGALISEGITDIVMALIDQGQETFNKQDYIKGKLISYGISIVTMGIGAIASSTKILTKAMNACKSLANKLRAVEGLFAKVCNWVAGKLEKLADFLQLTINKIEFARKACADQVTHLTELHKSQNLAEFQQLQKLQKTSDIVISHSQKITQILKTASIGAVKGVAVSVATEKIFTATLNQIMQGLQPKIKEKIKDIVTKKINANISKLKKYTAEQINEQFKKLFETTLREDVEHVVKEISLGVLRHSSNWKMQLGTLVLDGILSGVEISQCADKICDKLLRDLPELSEEANHHEHDYEKIIIDPLSETISGVMYSKIVSITGKVVTTLPKIFYRGYQEHKEKKADNEAINLMKDRIDKITNAEKAATQTGTTCGHDSVAASLGIDAEHLAHSSGLAMSTEGATQEEIRILYTENGINTTECSVENAVQQLGASNSDRAVVCLRTADGSIGHAIPVTLENSQLMVIAHNGTKVPLDNKYCTDNGYGDATVIVPHGVNSTSIADGSISHRVNRNRIERVTCPIRHVGQIEGQRFGSSSMLSRYLNRPLPAEAGNDVRILEVDYNNNPSKSYKEGLNSLKSMLNQKDGRKGTIIIAETKGDTTIRTEMRAHDLYIVGVDIITNGTSIQHRIGENKNKNESVQYRQDAELLPFSASNQKQSKDAIIASQAFAWSESARFRANYDGPPDLSSSPKPYNMFNNPANITARYRFGSKGYNFDPMKQLLTNWQKLSNNTYVAPDSANSLDRSVGVEVFHIPSKHAGDSSILGRREISIEYWLDYGKKTLEELLKRNPSSNHILHNRKRIK